jgi:DNA-binding PadR family transcriptional regulator
MTAVFSHGRLRLYLLKLLGEGPKHGYELIRLLENRFLGLYAPSAGTIYPRLARLEAEGLVTFTATGGRKVYDITDAGRAELAARHAELVALESDIHASVADLSTLATDIEREVSGSVRDIKRELREASRQASAPPRPPWASGRPWDWRSWAAAGRADDATHAGGAGHAGGGQDAGRGAGRGAGGADGIGEASAGLERAVGELAAEVTRLARRAGANEADLHAATAVVASALTELRRLLRR